MSDVALEVPLRCFAPGWFLQGHHANYSWVGSFHDPFDGAALAGGIAAFEDHADLEALGYHPLLEFHQLPLQTLELTFVGLAIQPFPGGRCLFAHVTTRPVPTANSPAAPSPARSARASTAELTASAVNRSASASS